MEPPLEPAPRALRRHFARHNWRALGMAFVSLVGAALLWGLLYLGIYWFALVGTTVGRSLKGPESIETLGDPRQLLGAHFPLKFAAVAAGILALTALLQRRLRFQPLREQHGYLLWIIVEIIMMIPNITFAVWGNLRAVVWLNRREMAQAWALLRRIGEQEGGRLPVSGLGLEISGDGQARQQVLFALQLTDLVGMQEGAEGWVLTLASEEARALCRPPEAAPAGEVEEAEPPSEIAPEGELRDE